MKCTTLFFAAKPDTTPLLKSNRTPRLGRKQRYRGATAQDRATVHHHMTYRLLDTRQRMNF